MTACEKIYAAFAKSLLDDVVNAPDPWSDHVVDILAALREEYDRNPVTLEILERTKIGKCLTKTVKACSTRHNRNNDDWEEALKASTALLLEFKQVAFEQSIASSRDIIGRADNNKFAASKKQGPARSKTNERPPKSDGKIAEAGGDKDDATRRPRDLPRDSATGVKARGRRDGSGRETSLGREHRQSRPVAVTSEEATDDEFSSGSAVEQETNTRQENGLSCLVAVKSEEATDNEFSSGNAVKHEDEDTVDLSDFPSSEEENVVDAEANVASDTHKYGKEPDALVAVDDPGTLDKKEAAGIDVEGGNELKPAKANESLGDLSLLTCVQLRDRLRKLNLQVRGRKQELIDRLDCYLNPTLQDAGDDSESAAAGSKASKTSRKRNVSSASVGLKPKSRNVSKDEISSEVEEFWNDNKPSNEADPAAIPATPPPEGKKKKENPNILSRDEISSEVDDFLNDDKPGNEADPAAIPATAPPEGKKKKENPNSLSRDEILSEVDDFLNDDKPGNEADPATIPATASPEGKKRKENPNSLSRDEISSGVTDFLNDDKPGNEAHPAAIPATVPTEGKKKQENPSNLSRDRISSEVDKFLHDDKPGNEADPAATPATTPPEGKKKKENPNSLSREDISSEVNNLLNNDKLGNEADPAAIPATVPPEGKKKQENPNSSSRDEILSEVDDFLNNEKLDNEADPAAIPATTPPEGKKKKENPNSLSRDEIKDLMRPHIPMLGTGSNGASFRYIMKKVQESVPHLKLSHGRLEKSFDEELETRYFLRPFPFCNGGTTSGELQPPARPPSEITIDSGIEGTKPKRGSKVEKKYLSNSESHAEVEEFLLSLLPRLRREDVEEYCASFARDGFDSHDMLDGVEKEDLNFMKKAHRRELWKRLEKSRGKPAVGPADSEGTDAGVGARKKLKKKKRKRETKSSKSNQTESGSNGEVAGLEAGRYKKKEKKTHKKTKD